MALRTSRHGSATDAGASETRRRRRRWPWILAAVGVVMVGAMTVTLLRHSSARPVDLNDARGRYHGPGLAGPNDPRPTPGVYSYTGAGTDRLSLPPMSQAEGPSMPVTVTLDGSQCWTMRVDYSTHHWQTWAYCRDGGALEQTGGGVWQLWPVGPINFTNRTTLTCSPPLTVVPATLTVGQSWPISCTGTSTAVKGQMTSSGTIRFLGDTTLRVAGHDVSVRHFLQTQTDSGSQRGTERYENWLDPVSGLPLKMQQDIEVRTATPFGDSTYTQTGSMTIESLQPTS